MKNFGIYVICWAFLLVSCTKQVEVVEEQYGDGSPKRVVIYEVSGSDKTKVAETDYFSNGHKRMSGKFVDSKRDGKWEAWHENGTLWSVGHYDKGIRTGEAMVYHDNGKVHIKGAYLNDQPHGTWQWFDKHGELVNELQYGKE